MIYFFVQEQNSQYMTHSLYVQYAVQYVRKEAHILTWTAFLNLTQFLDEKSKYENLFVYEMQHLLI